VERVGELIEACGAVQIPMLAAAHDDAVAAISHMPLVVSAALVEAVAGGPGRARAGRLAGGRSARRHRLGRHDAPGRGEPAMGAGIAATNSAAIASRLRDVRGRHRRVARRAGANGGPDAEALRGPLRLGEETARGSGVAMSAAPELVYAVPRDVLMGRVDVARRRTANVEEILAALDRRRVLPRPAAEADTTIKQIIPYLVLRDGDRIFLMKRTRAGGDARLHDHYSIGVGGHMNPGDESVLVCLAREWREELLADFVPGFEFLGLLNDDEVEVGRHHLGVVYLADAAGGRWRFARRTSSGAFEPLEVVRRSTIAWKRGASWYSMRLTTEPTPRRSESQG
jgi:predicted NUDIX family phosphoesterase